MYIKFVDIYTDTPGARYRKDGKYSGEEFRDDILIPALIESLKRKEKLYLDLDGAYGYPTGFLDEVFGGLIRMNLFKTRTIKEKLVIISDEAEYLKNEIKRDMEEGKKYVKHKRK